MPALLCLVVALAAPAAALAAGSGAPDLLPADHRASTQTIGFPRMEAFLRSVDGKGPVSLTVEGKSASGRPIHLVRLKRGEGSWKVLLYAQQHGDEPSGKDALLYLIRDIVRDPGRLPADVDLWLMPCLNPDGAEAGTRRNGAGADLNRDHLALEQPETQALHRVARRLRPHLAVDCHEFSRDYGDKGWRERSVITMDGLDNPLFDAALVRAGGRWLRRASALLERAGHPFSRYWVGGTPPDEEQRHSAPDVDGGLNGIGMYGGLSFIIEANSERPLGERVDAYLALFRLLLGRELRQPEDLAAVERSRRRGAPGFIPVNYLWANPGNRVTMFRVLEAATGRTLRVPTPNMMTQVVVKRSVPAPAAYAVPPAAAGPFAALLESHGIPFKRLSAPMKVRAELCRLERVEESFDELYSRYEGRQIVERQAPAAAELPSGGLLVPLEGATAVRAALVLEPAQLYGLYQYPRYKALAAEDGTLPVWRVLAR